MDLTAAIAEELKQRIEEAKREKLEQTQIRLTQSQQFLLKIRKKKLTGIVQKPNWKRPRDARDCFTELKPLKQLVLTPVELYRINLLDRTYEKQPTDKTPFTYTSAQGKEFGKPPAKIFSKAAQTMIQAKEKEYEKIKEERRQAELEKLKKRRKINEERINNMPRFVTTFAPKGQLSNIEFDKV